MGGPFHERLELQVTLISTSLMKFLHLGLRFEMKNSVPIF